jgi:hypothetical protein
MNIGAVIAALGGGDDAVGSFLLQAPGRKWNV